MSVSMGHAVKSLKTHLARMSEEATTARAGLGLGGGSGDGASRLSGAVNHCGDAESRRKTLAHLEYFEREKVVKAGKSIAEHGANEIRDGDVVVTYGASHHAFEILKEAKRRNTTFRVIVVDAEPNLEGVGVCDRLRAVGIAVAYVSWRGLAYALRKGGATKILLGAAAVLANGAVISRAGAAVIAASGFRAGVPVLVAAETCKFHERVQLDAVAHNELGDPNDVLFGAKARRGSGTRGAFAEASLGRDRERNPEAVAVGGSGGGSNYGDSRSTDRSDVSSAGDSKDRGGSVVSPDARDRNDGRPPPHPFGSRDRIRALHLKYDNTPGEFVRFVVCESGAVSPADIPSFLR
jgi:translation initiation factor eIF-2B subunit delta